MEKYYAGIAHRGYYQSFTPLVIAQIVKNLEGLGYTARLGENWNEGTHFTSYVHTLIQSVSASHENILGAMAIAEKFTPNWHKCSDLKKGFYGSNVLQILGPNLNPEEKSNFIFCWAPHCYSMDAMCSKKAGFHRTAIRVANAYKVPVFNLADTVNTLIKWMKWADIKKGELAEYKARTRKPIVLYTHDIGRRIYVGSINVGYNGWRKFGIPWKLLQRLKMLKRGIGSKQEFISLYETHLGTISGYEWRQLFDAALDGELIFVCPCKKGQLCHRDILVNYILKNYNSYNKISYGGWWRD